MHGRGVYRSAEGAVYEGEHQDDKMHGRGVCRYASCNVYEGEYQDGKYHGRGVLRFADGSIAHDGQWKDGEPANQLRSILCQRSTHSLNQTHSLTRSKHWKSQRSRTSSCKIQSGIHTHSLTHSLIHLLKLLNLLTHSLSHSLPDAQLTRQRIELQDQREKAVTGAINDEKHKYKSIINEQNCTASIAHSKEATLGERKTEDLKVTGSIVISESPVGGNTFCSTKRLQ